MKFTRYAIYYAPAPKAEWATFATSWLGWDMRAGRPVEHPQIPDISVSQITRTPRKYGLHATLKPPFRLADGITQSDLEAACHTLSQRLSPVSLGQLQLTRMGRFLALCQPSSPELSRFAGACVCDLDHLRAPLTPEELARRRKARLTQRQEGNLTTWGYPYVLDDFRFHVTLTGRLSDPDLKTVQSVLDHKLVPLLPLETVITDLALTGEDEAGCLHLLHRFDLSE